MEWNLEKREWSNERKNSKKPYIELTCPSLPFIKAILRWCEDSPNSGKDGMLLPERTHCTAPHAPAHTHASWQVAANEIEDLDLDFADPPEETA